MQRPVGTAGRAAIIPDDILEQRQAGLRLRLLRINHRTVLVDSRLNRAGAVAGITRDIPGR